MYYNNFRKQLVTMSNSLGCIHNNTDNIIFLANNTNPYMIINDVDKEILVTNKEPITVRYESKNKYYFLGSAYTKLKCRPKSTNNILDYIKKDIIRRKEELSTLQVKVKKEEIKNIDV